MTNSTYDLPADKPEEESMDRTWLAVAAVRRDARRAAP
jgi:hypothetical protein